MRHSTPLHYSIWIFFSSIVSGANDRNRMSEVAILEMTPTSGAPTDITFCTFEDEDDYWFEALLGALYLMNHIVKSSL